MLQRGASLLPALWLKCLALHFCMYIHTRLRCLNGYIVCSCRAARACSHPVDAIFFSSRPHDVAPSEAPEENSDTVCLSRRKNNRTSRTRFFDSLHPPLWFPSELPLAPTTSCALPLFNSVETALRVAVISLPSRLPAAAAAAALDLSSDCSPPCSSSPTIVMASTCQRWCVCVCMSVCIFGYAYTHTHTPTFSLPFMRATQRRENMCVRAHTHIYRHKNLPEGVSCASTAGEQLREERKHDVWHAGG